MKRIHMHEYEYNLCEVHSNFVAKTVISTSYKVTLRPHKA